MKKRSRKGFLKKLTIPDYLLFLTGLSASQKLILGCVYSFAILDQQCGISNEKIANLCSMKVEKVTTEIMYLTSAKLIDVRHSDGVRWLKLSEDWHPQNRMFTDTGEEL